MTEEITLASGVLVRVRPVSPLIVVEVVSHNSELRDPPIPLVEVKGVAGTEVMPARPGEKEYEEWMQARADVEDARSRLQDDLVWSWGVVEWRYPKGKFTRWPPKDWKFPEVLKGFGLQPREGKGGHRLDFIKYELFQTPSDVEATQQVLYGTTSPLTESEVGSARDLFPGNQTRTADTTTTQ